MGKDTKSPYEQKKKKGAFVGKRTKDVFIFLFFVFICTVFWFVREMEDSFSTEVVVPVKLTDVPKDVIITTDVPKEVRLSIHAKGVELIPYFLGKDADTLRVSFNSYDNHEKSGHGILLLSQLQGSLRKILSPGATISSMSPDTVYFYYNRGLHKRLPVRMRGEIEAAQQYCVIGTRFVPDSVDVFAPLALLDTMTAAYTDRIYMREANKSSDTKIKIHTTRGMRSFPDSVTLKTEVDILSRESVEIPIVGTNFPANKTLRTFPSSVKVSYLVPQSQAKNIDKSEFVVVITYDDLLKNGSNRCRPHLNNSPKGVTGAFIDPIEVDYLFENVASEDEKESKAAPTDNKKKGKK